jgi:putative PIN family toxin of toxin-antitoxin system
VNAPVAVIDTNVVVSGLLTGEPTAATRRILDAMLAGRFTYLLSVVLLSEYRDVLLRPRIRKRHGLENPDVDVILEVLAANAVIREPAVGDQEFPDPGDAHLWVLVSSDSRAVLVTGDLALVNHPASGVRVMSPAEFAEHADL